MKPIALLSFIAYSAGALLAVSTMRRQSSRIAAFLQADARPMFCWPRSASTARSQVWIGLPNGRFQSGGSPRITAATTRWWSSCGELRAMCPKSRKRLSVTRWERWWHPAGLDWPLCHCAVAQASPFDEHRRPWRLRNFLMCALRRKILLSLWPLAYASGRDDY